MGISFEQVMQKFSPEQQQHIQARVAELIAEDDRLKELIVEQYGGEHGDISELLRLLQAGQGKFSEPIGQLVLGLVAEQS